MTTIYRGNADRLSVADAKSLILKALPPERSVDVYARVDENGDFDFDGPIELKERMGIDSYEMFIHRDFQATCQSVNVQPRMRYSPALTDYTGTGSDDLIYTIAHDEFLRLAALYDLSVVVGRAPEPGAATPSPEPVPAAGVSGGTVTVWTPARKDAARLMRDLLRGQGNKAFAANTATAFGVSATRLRKVLDDKPKKAPAKNVKGVWDV